MTKKEIKGYIANGAAVDITNIPLGKAYELATHTTTSLSLLHGRIVLDAGYEIARQRFAALETETQQRIQMTSNIKEC